MGQSKLGLGST